MRIFDIEEGWHQKVNFVDENNALVGYDMAQDCCEEADWFISDKVILEPSYDFLASKNKSKEGLEGYIFDVDFFEEGSGGGGLDEGGVAVFKIFKGDDVKYIHIYNSHNGYYGHGFNTEGFKNSIEGCL